jgi:hypothetical protein
VASEIEGLLHGYEEVLHLPLDPGLAGQQRVWFAIYAPTQERRLRLHIPDFEVATKKSGRSWAPIDLTNAFAEWMAQHEYRDAYFAEPEYLDPKSGGFAEYLADRLKDVLLARDVDKNTIVAVSGIASLFGLASVSSLVEEVAPLIKGNLLVFFPGQKDGNNYRLLDARDGWNYMALAITAKEGD